MTDLTFAMRLAAAAYAAHDLDHPLRVMSGCSTPAGRIVAILHHTPGVSIEQLRRAKFSDEILVGLAFLQNAAGPPVKHRLDLILKNPIALEVTLADLRDHADLNQLPREVSRKDIKANEQLVAAIDYLERRMRREPA